MRLHDFLWKWKKLHNEEEASSNIKYAFGLVDTSECIVEHVDFRNVVVGMLVMKRKKIFGRGLSINCHKINIYT